MPISLPEIYSLSLNQATIDADHILLTPELVGFLPEQAELDLGDAGSAKVRRDGEVLQGRGLVKKLSRLGNLLQWFSCGDRVRVTGLALDGGENVVENSPGRLQTEDSSLLLERAWRGDFPRPESFFLARELLDLSVKPGFDQLLSFRATTGVMAYPHQVNTVKSVLRQMKGRALLCDEVGLGKTVEAGLVMMEYLLRGLVKRVLILTPPSLIHQWQDEMAQKFNQDFVLSDSAEFVKAGAGAWQRFLRIIASIDLAKRGDHLEQVMATRFDLVIVDEAHRLRHRTTAAWKLVNGLDKKYILLLTATPVQNDLDELFNLITLLRPGQLKTESEFRRQFVVRGDRLKPQNVEQLKLQVSQVMVRNRRSSTGIQFTQRRAQTVRTEPAPEEERLYRLVTEIVRQAYLLDRPPLSRLVLKTVQMESGSSPGALAATAERLLLGGLPPPHGPRLKEVYDLARSIRQSAKLSALQKTLAPLGKEKVVIFTHYMPTLAWLRESLKDHSLAVYHGGLSARDKDEAVERFRGDAQLLLSTDSGGEGRNLQFCHMMVNFDLPWNPMRIEQRIGRLSRIGQQRDVYIFNLSTRGTVDDQILEILDRKINLFELVVGELDLILGRLGEEKDLEETIMELVGTSRSDEELRVQLDQIGARLQEARGQYEDVKSLDESLFGEVVSA